MGRVPLLISSTLHHEGGIDCVLTFSPIPVYITQQEWAIGLLGQRQRQDNKQQPLRRAGAFVCMAYITAFWGIWTIMKKTGFQTHLPMEFNRNLGLKKVAMIPGSIVRVWRGHIPTLCSMRCSEWTKWNAEWGPSRGLTDQKDVNEWTATPAMRLRDPTHRWAVSLLMSITRECCAAPSPPPVFVI